MEVWIPLKVHEADLHPMTRRDEGHFPGSPFSLPCVPPPHPSAQAVLAPVQFNFSRAHRLVLSPSDPSVSPPRKKRLSYFLPL